MKNSYVGYGAFSTTDKGKSEASWVAIEPTIDSVQDSLSRFQDPAYKHALEDSQKAAVDVESAVGKGVWSFYSQLKSFYEIASIAEVIPMAFVSSFFKRELVEHAETSFAKVAEFGGASIFGLSDTDMAYVNRQTDRWNSISDGFAKLPAALLLSLVAGFDSAFADFVRVLLKSKPERYSGSDRQYSISDILKLDSLEQLISKAADDEVDQLMNKSHTEQITFFEKSFDISIREHYSRWGQFVEIFERRNLAAHGNLIINERYITNCSKAGLVVEQCPGEELRVNEEYLEKSIDILIEFGILLALAAWQKQYPKSIAETFGAVVEVSYSLLKDGHPSVAARILDYGLKVKSKGADEEKTKMMIINLAIAHKLNGDEKSALDLLDKTDWSASPPQFKLCLASIKEDVEAACALLDAARVSDELSPTAIREWPAFRWVRQNDKFKKSCEEVFGEPIFPTSVVSNESSSTEKDAEDKAVPAARRRRPPLGRLEERP